MVDIGVEWNWAMEAVECRVAAEFGWHSGQELRRWASRGEKLGHHWKWESYYLDLGILKFLVLQNQNHTYSCRARRPLSEYVWV